MYVKQKGKIKDTKTNRIIALTYYGYSNADIADILNASSGHIYETIRKYPVEQPLTRPVPVSMFQTKAEKDLFKGYTKQINEVYKKHQLTQQDEEGTTNNRQVAKSGTTVTNTPNAKPIVNTEEVIEEEPLLSKGSLTFGDDEEDVTEAIEDERVTSSQELVDEFYSDGEVRSKGYMEYLIAVETELDEDGNCELCSNKGWVMAPGPKGIKKSICPVCLGESTRKKQDKVSEYDKQTVLKELIPNEAYRTNNFDFEDFSRGILLPKEMRGYSYDQYINFMNSILVGLNNGELPNKSYYIVAPDGYGKKWFAYEVIKLMVENNFKTSGLLDTIELSQLLDTRDYDKLREKLDVDIIMVSLTGLNRGYYSHVVKYLTEYADSQGKPLFLFARVEAATFVAGDRGMAGLIFSQTGPHDYGKLMQVGLQGKEYAKAYQLLVNESNESIGYQPKYNNKK